MVARHRASSSAFSAVFNFAAADLPLNFMASLPDPMNARLGWEIRSSTWRPVRFNPHVPERCRSPVVIRPRLILLRRLRFKRRLKAVVREFRKRYRQFESTPLRHRVPDYRLSATDVPEIGACPALVAIVVHRRKLIL